MKDGWNIIKQYASWLLLFLSLDIFGALLLWLADVEAFRALLAVIFLTSCLLLAAALGYAGYRTSRRKKAFRDFLRTPEKKQEELFLKLSGPAWKQEVRILGETLREKERLREEALVRMEDYEKYVEIWAHEVKAPLSLLTLLLDNRRDELPDSLGTKLNIIRSRMQEYVEQMLYYARLKSARKDYYFEPVNIMDSVTEVLEDYQSMLEEKQFRILFPQVSRDKETVYTDRRGLRFLVSQVISNAVKYSSARPELEISLTDEGNCRILSVMDNGTGVRACDLPYIFEKGFTGDSGEERMKATGMGLYLAREIAGEMNLVMEAESRWRKGFEMKIKFPL